MIVLKCDRVGCDEHVEVMDVMSGESAAGHVLIAAYAGSDGDAAGWVVELGGSGLDHVLHCPEHAVELP